jgi:ABC-type sulfate transport system substrate-binding protein
MDLMNGSVAGERVILAADEYEALLDEVDLLRELCVAQAEIAAEDTVSEEEALSYIRSAIAGVYAECDYDATCGRADEPRLP